MTPWIPLALVALPALGAAAAAAVARDAVGPLARGAAAATLLAALVAGALLGADRGGRLATAWEAAARDGLARRGVHDVALTDEAVAALGAGALGPERARALAERWAGLDAAQAALEALERRYALGLAEDAELEPARAAALDAGAEARRLEGLAASLEREVRPLRAAALGPRGATLAGVGVAAWLAPLGLHVAVGVDGLSVALAALIALLALVGAQALPAGDDASRGAAAGLLVATAGAQALVVGLDLVTWTAGWTLVGVGSLTLARSAAPLRTTGLVGEAVAVAAGAAAAAALALGDPAGVTTNLLAVAPSPAAQAAALALLLLGAAARLPLLPAPEGRLVTRPALAPGLGAFVDALGFVVAGAALLRIAWPLCGEVARAPMVAGAVGAVGVVHAARVGLACLGERDLAAVAARAPALGAGPLLVGLAAATPVGHAGAALALIGFAAAGVAATLAVGALDERTRRDPDALGGLAPRLPRLAALSAIAFLSLGGAPGGVGFPAWLLAVAGAWASPVLPRAVGAAALAGLALGGAGLAWGWARAFLGSSRGAPIALRDVTGRESLTLVPWVALCVVLGVAPWVALDWIEPALRAALGG